MIRIERSPNIPDVLNSRGRPETKMIKKDFDDNPSDYQTGKKKFTIKNNIYGDKTVKDELINMQYGKCCYCEAEVRSCAPGDVEHFRPKGAVKQNRSASKEIPGYFWLAYEWDNLLFVCENCNRYNKGDVFPLADPTNRAKSHHDDIGREDPILIDPSQEDPMDYITFRGYVAASISGSQRGNKTIDIVGLNRLGLEERRMEYYELMKDVFLSLKSSIGSSKADSIDLLNNLTESEKQFAGMMRAALKDDFRY